MTDKLSQTISQIDRHASSIGGAMQVKWEDMRLHLNEIPEQDALAAVEIVQAALGWVATHMEGATHKPAHDQ